MTPIQTEIAADHREIEARQARHGSTRGLPHHDSKDIRALVEAGVLERFRGSLAGVQGLSWYRLATAPTVNPSSGL